jgi:scyllo-inositol 2-dehydrogenase (NADP+)
MIDVGLVGFGFAGRTFHVPVLGAVPGLRLSAIVQRTGSDASAICPDARIVRSLPELLAIKNIQLVVVATPNASHYKIARECLLSGRDVIIDKPFAATWDEANELTQAAKTEGRLLSIYQNRRWDGDFLTVRQLVASGTLGRLVLYESHFDRYRPQVRPNAWRERNEPGSGLLVDLGAHLIDQALVLFGPPESVGAEIRRERDAAVVDDAFDVTLHYPSHRALLGAGMLACAPGPRFLLHGLRGSYVKYGLDPQEEALKRGERPVGVSWGAEPESAWGILSTAEDGGVKSQATPTQPGDYRRYYENVRDAMLGQATLAVAPEQALDVLKIIDLARESSRRGCALPWKK